jgi:hypothetical protein
LAGADCADFLLVLILLHELEDLVLCDLGYPGLHIAVMLHMLEAARDIHKDLVEEVIAVALGDVEDAQEETHKAAISPIESFGETLLFRGTAGHAWFAEFPIIRIGAIRHLPALPHTILAQFAPINPCKHL